MSSLVRVGCPKCSSSEISTMYAKWECYSCGHDWEPKRGPSKEEVAAEADKWHYNGVNGSRAFLAGMKYLKENPGAAL